MKAVFPGTRPGTPPIVTAAQQNEAEMNKLQIKVILSHKVSLKLQLVCSGDRCHSVHWAPAVNLEARPNQVTWVRHRPGDQGLDQELVQDQDREIDLQTDQEQDQQLD